MKVFTLLIALAMTVTAFAQFGLLTEKRIDVIRPNTQTNVQINAPGGQLDVVGLTSGELIYDDGFGLQSLPNGTEGQLLSITGGVLAYIDPPATSPTTTVGDIIYNNLGTPSGDTRLPIGSEGQVLTVDAGQPRWNDKFPFTTDGDLLYDNAGFPDRLPIGADGQVLTVNAGQPSWEDATGGSGGGSAGVNFIADGSFEELTYTPDNNLGATVFFGTHAVDDELYSDTNTRFRQLSNGFGAPDDAFIRDSVARTGLDGRQGLFSIYVKSDTEDFQLCLRIDDSAFAGACETALTVDVVGDGSWRKYEIPFLYGSTSVEWELFRDSFTGSSNIEIDLVYLGTLPDGYIGSAPEALTALTANELSARVTNPSGLVESNYDWMTCASGQTSPYTCNFNSGIFTSLPICVVTTEDGSGTRVASVTALSTSSITVRTFASSTGSASTVSFFLQCSKTGADVNKTPVGGTDTIVQARQQTRATENVFGAYVNEFGNVTGDTLDFIDGNCAITATSTYTCQLRNDLNITQRMSCATSQSNTDREITYSTLNSNTSQIQFITRDGTGANNPSRFQIVCTKHADDWNTSITVAGKFSDTARKCQSKRISGDVTSTGVFMTFNNLVVGKRYEYFYKFRCENSTGSVATTKQCQIRVFNGATILSADTLTVSNSPGSVTFLALPAVGSYSFVATDTTLDFNAVTLANMLIVGDSFEASETATLCELTDSIYETTTGF